MISVFAEPKQATQYLHQGKLLAYPTESVWGIGCDAMNKTAVKRILSIKNRPIEKGMIVVTDSIERVEPFLSQLPLAQRKMIVTSWMDTSADMSVADKNNTDYQKQATTWLLPIPLDVEIPSWITGGHDCVAIRVIAHPLIRQVCSNLVSDSNPYGFLISTSCNPAGKTPAQNIKQAQAYFDYSDEVVYLSGQTLNYRLPSQIRDGLTLDIIR